MQKLTLSEAAQQAEIAFISQRYWTDIPKQIIYVNDNAAKVTIKERQPSKEQAEKVAQTWSDAIRKHFDGYFSLNVAVESADSVVVCNEVENEPIIESKIKIIR